MTTSSNNCSSTKQFHQMNENEDQDLIEENENIQESSKSLQFIYDDESSTDSLIEEKIKEFRLDHHENEDIQENEQLISDRYGSKQEGEQRNSHMEWGNSIQKEQFKQIEEEVTEEEAATEEEHNEDEQEEVDCNFKCFSNYSDQDNIRKELTQVEQNGSKSNVEMMSVTEESANYSKQQVPQKLKDLGERTLSLSKLKASLAVFKSVDISCFQGQQNMSQQQLLNGQTDMRKDKQQGKEEQDDIQLFMSEQFISKKELLQYSSNKLAQICSRTIPQDLSGREVMFLRNKSQKPQEIQQIQSQQIQGEILISNRSNHSVNNSNNLKESVINKEFKLYKENEDPHTPCVRKNYPENISNDQGCVSENIQSYQQQSLTNKKTQKDKINLQNPMNCYSNGFKDNSYSKNSKTKQVQEEQEGFIKKKMLAEDNYQQYLGFIQDCRAEKEEGSLFLDRGNNFKEMSHKKFNGSVELVAANKRNLLNYCTENEETTAFETVMDLKLNRQHSNTSSLSPKYRKGNNIIQPPESKSTSAASCFLTSSKSNNNSQGTITNGHFGNTSSNAGSIFLDNGFNSGTQTFLNNPRNLHHYHQHTYHHHPNYYLSSSNGNKTMNISTALTRNQGGLVVTLKRNNNLNSSNTSDQSRSASKGRGFASKTNSRNNSFTNSQHITAGKTNLLIVDHANNNTNNNFMNFHSNHAHSLDINSQKSQQKSKQLLYNQKGINPETTINNSYSNSRNSISPSHRIQIRTRSQQKPQIRYLGNSIFTKSNTNNIYENLRRQHSLSQDGHTRSSTDDKIFNKLNVTSSNEYPAAETQPSIEPRTSLNEVFTRNLLTSSLNLNISGNIQHSNNTSNQDFSKNSQTYNHHHTSFSNSHTQQRINLNNNQTAYAKMNGKFKRTAMIYLNSNSSLQKQHPQSYFKNDGITINNQSQISSLQSTILQPSRTKVRILRSAKQQPTVNYLQSRQYAATPELDNIRNQHTMQTLPSALSLTLEQHIHHLSQGNRENYIDNNSYPEQFGNQKLLLRAEGGVEKERLINQSNSSLLQPKCQQQPQFYLKNNSNSMSIQQQSQPHHIQASFPYNSLKPNRKQNIFSARGGSNSIVNSGQSRKNSSTIHNYLKNDPRQLDITMNSLKSTSAFYNQQDLSFNDSYLQLEDQQQINHQPFSSNSLAKTKSQLNTSSELRDKPPKRQGRSVQHKLMGNNDSLNNITLQNNNNNNINNCKNNFLNNQLLHGKKNATQIASSSYLKNNNSSDFLRFTSSVCERPFMKSPQEHHRQHKSNKRVLSQEDSQLS